jgi:putative ATP-dependent endonuclease of the OLD family
VIDTLVQLYQAHEIKTYVIFDNDKGKTPEERAYNKVICRVIEIPETDLPAPQISDHYAILDGNWEQQVQADLASIDPNLYLKLVAEARAVLGIKGNKNKPLVARYIAEQLVARNVTLPFIKNITEKLKQRLGLIKTPPDTNSDFDFQDDASDEDIPF